MTAMRRATGRFAAIFLSTILVAGLTGCDPAKPARDSIAVAKGILITLQAQHQECKADPSPAICQNINRGVAAENLAIDALEVYCSGPEFDAGTGPCQPSPEKTLRENAARKLAAAITNLNQIIGDLKKAVNP